MGNPSHGKELNREKQPSDGGAVYFRHVVYGSGKLMMQRCSPYAVSFRKFKMHLRLGTGCIMYRHLLLTRRGMDLSVKC